MGLPFERSDMPEDPYALKLFIDGNCYRQRGRAGAIACAAKFPESRNREDEIIFAEGFFETTNNRMELLACICAHEYIAEQGRSLGVERVQIVTDSMYVNDNHLRVTTWRSAGWCNAHGRPIENSDLWKRLLTAKSKVKVRTEILWQKGKKSPILKMVDRAAKEAGKSPQSVDRGYRGGKVASSKVAGGSPALYVAKGEQKIIRIYRSGLLRKTGHKVTFDLYDELSATYSEKCYAYTEAHIIAELHRQHCYRVSFNSDPKYPIILSILEELDCALLAPALPIDDSDGSD